MKKLDDIHGNGEQGYFDNAKQQGIMASFTALGLTNLSIYFVRATGTHPADPDGEKHGIIFGICLSDCTEPQRQLVEKFVSDLESIDEQQS